MKGNCILAATLFVLSLSCGLSAAAFGENYYRWTGPDGVVHYGSRPPDGVDAVKIDTFGKSQGTEINGENPSNSAEKKEDVASAQALEDTRKQQCEEERTRLGLLTSSGSRIRMKQPDGSTRYLTPDEIAQEVSQSREFISQACK